MFITSALVIFLSYGYGVCKMEGMILNGMKADIRNFPHLAYLMLESASGASACGSSILNQRILVTAAHCMDACRKCKTLVTMGNTNCAKGSKFTVIDSYVHQNWTNHKFTNDIALLFLHTPINLTDTMKRVVIMNTPPSDKKAQVAGWGLIGGKKGKDDQENLVATDTLQYTDVVMASNEECGEILHQNLSSIFCAEGDKSEVTRGDSGGGLIARKYILTGIVSFGIPNKSKTLAFYTNVSYFYKWIQENSKLLYCKNYFKNETRRCT